jgi:integrase
VVGAYLPSLADTHAPATIRRRLSRSGKMHRYNDLPWDAAHGAIQGPLQACRAVTPPSPKPAALSLAIPRQLLVTCDRTVRGRRDRALLLFGFAGALRRSELVTPTVGVCAFSAARPTRKGRGPRSTRRQKTTDDHPDERKFARIRRMRAGALIETIVGIRHALREGFPAGHHHAQTDGRRVGREPRNAKESG